MEPPPRACSPEGVPDDVVQSLHSLAFRLPPHMLPQHYALEFQPDAVRHTFTGAMYVTIRVTQAPLTLVRHLILHALGLTIAAEAVRVFVPADPVQGLSEEAAAMHPSRCRPGDDTARQRPFSEETGRYVRCVDVLHVAESETALFVFDGALPCALGDMFVLIVDRFEGAIAVPPDMEGLFHSNEADASMLSTHLEPTDARRLYPCFDEPAIQSTFHLSVIAAAGQMALSNTEMEADIAVTAPPYGPMMALPASARKSSGSLCDVASIASPSPSGASASSSPKPSHATTLAPTSSAPPAPWHCVRFQRTPPLHTCIVGFHVGRFIILEQRSRRSRILCRVVLPHTDASSSGWFALDLATKAVDFFEEFFGVGLPLTKLDVVGLPAFGVLGMENWGMINLARNFLVVTDTTPLERRQRITRLIGHEVCHQWFGNRVSIEWWSCLWLKEGMCRYLEYFFVNAVFPCWGLWNEFLCNIMNGALLADANPGATHPVGNCNPAPRRIYDAFDAISYGKGACLLRMIFSIIGVEWLKRATHLLMVRFAEHAFNAKDFGDCIVDTAEGRGSGDTEVQHAQAIRWCLAMVDAVSHPYLYIHQQPGESYTITQYVAPSKQHGLLVEYVQYQRSRADAPALDLCSNPSRSSFEWAPETTLTPVTKPYCVPLRSVQWMPSGHGSVRLIFLEEAVHRAALGVPGASLAARSPQLLPPAAMLRDTRTPSSSAGGAPSSSPPSTPASSPPVFASGGLCYFNQGGSGFFQCDYDAATWRRLFDLVAYFSEEDRMIITMHFINTAKAQLGRQPGEPADTDRCTLFFEWLLRLTNAPGAMNSFLWEIVTNALTTIVQLVQQYYCHTIVKEFVNSLYTPLQRRCVLSFFAQEKTVSFQSGIHLSRQLVLRILQLLCLCDNPAVCEEAEETAQWALAALLSLANSPVHTASSLSATTGTTAAPAAATATATSTTSNGASASAGTVPIPSLSVASVSVGLHHAQGPNANAGSPLSADTPPPARASTAHVPVTSAPIAVTLLPRRESAPQPVLGSAPASHSRPTAAATGFVPSPGKLLRGSSAATLLGHVASSAPRPAPLLSATAGAAEQGSSTSMFAASFSHGASALLSERAGGKAPNARSYPCQRTGDFNLEDSSHTQAGAIALSHLVSQDRTEYWVAAAAIAVEQLLLPDRDELQRVSGVTPPVVRTQQLSPEQRRLTLRLVLPPIFAYDQESAFPFMAGVLRSAPSLDQPSVMALYRNSRFFVYLLSTQHLARDRNTMDYLLRHGAEVCGNGYVVAQLKQIVQGGLLSVPTSAAASVNRFRGVEFADHNPTARSSASSSTTAPPRASSPRATATVSERRALRMLYPVAAAALDCMEANCVWMDYCSSHYDQFLRDQLQRKTWRPVRNGAAAAAQLSTPLTADGQNPCETFGGVSI